MSTISITEDRLLIFFFHLHKSYISTSVYREQNKKQKEKTSKKQIVIMENVYSICIYISYHHQIENKEDVKLDA
jgi:hypothetical protein